MFPRLTIAVGAIGASLAFAAPALAHPAPAGSHRATHITRTTHAVRPAATGPSVSEFVATSGKNTNGNGSANTCRLESKPCKTIQYAISQADTTAGVADRINVAAGTYPEQLTITGGDITIAGSTSAQTIIAPTTLTTDMNSPDEMNDPEAVIVDFSGAAGGGLTSVQVNGSKASSTIPADGSCDTDYVGVEFANSSGTLSKDLITGVQESANYQGCQNPDGGVYADNNTGEAYKVKVKDTRVTAYQKDGITCNDPGTTCTVNGATVTGNGPEGVTGQNGIEISGGASGLIKGSTVSGNSYTSPNYTGAGTYYTEGSGVIGFGAVNLTVSASTLTGNDVNLYDYTDQSGQTPAQGSLSITGNTIENATNDTGTASGSTAVPIDSGVGDGLDLDGVTDATVTGNTVTDNADYGIGLFGVNGSTIGGTASGEPNTVSGNTADGIFIGLNSNIANATEAPMNDVVQGNTVNTNGQVGIHADSNAADDSFLANVLQKNINFDAEDDSTGGTGTSGTSNTWTGNMCKPAHDSTPAGLCS